MSKKDYFQFKSFQIYHKNAPLKVGTDAVILGAITEQYLQQHSSLQHILDLGCGTGVIGHILLQGLPHVSLQFLDIQEECIDLTEKNIALNQLLDRSKVYISSFEDFKPSKPLDFIVCNPPFYFNSLESEHQGRNLSKHSHHIDWDKWWSHSFHITSKNGACAFIFPSEHALSMIEVAKKAGWFLREEWHIAPTPLKEAHRQVLLFEKHPCSKVNRKQLIIEEERHQYTQAYIELCKHLYLNF